MVQILLSLAVLARRLLHLLGLFQLAVVEAVRLIPLVRAAAPVVVVVRVAQFHQRLQVALLRHPVKVMPVAAVKEPMLVITTAVVGVVLVRQAEMQRQVPLVLEVLGHYQPLTETVITTLAVVEAQ